MKSRLLSILLTCACASLARADFNPVALTPGSYTYGIVVPAGTPQALPYCLDVTAGDGTGLGDNSYYEQTFYAAPGLQGSNSGIPIHNTVFTNINNPNVTFLMPPDYTVNNELMIDATFTTGGFTFNSPTSATNLDILCAGGGGPVTVNYTVTHSDNSTETGTLTLPDWFGGGAAVAWGANGRVSSGGGFDSYNSSSVNDNPPYLYSESITVSGATPITGIAFDSPTANHGNFFAVSGNDSGTNWTPIVVNPDSFNVMAIVPAAIPYPVTATMDDGTNLTPVNAMTTWFESGYIRDGTEAGLPPSGSVFASQSQPSHYYQMGDYSTNNATLIDQNHLFASLTPVSPASYSAISFLTAGANIGSGQMTNICIIQHADGVNETNIFLAYDWFNTSESGATAYSANGRVSMANRTLSNIGGTTPLLFESYFTLADTSSPVTNMVVAYYLAPSSSSTAYVMAVSASAGGVQPVITSGPLPTTEALFPGQTASFSVGVTGTAPLTNSWLVQINGNFVPLTDGLDANGSTIYGSGTETLVISNLTVADSGTYEFVAANAFGSQPGTATLTVLDTSTSLLWSPYNNSGVWDVNNSANWTNSADGLQTVFNNGNQVLFDDTVGVPTTVTVNNTVIPGAIIVDSSTNNFTLTGGTITGPGTLLKEGTSLLTDFDSGTLTGPAIIGGGTVSAANNSFSSVSSITVSNNATLDIAGGTFNNYKPVVVSGSGQNGVGALYNSYADYPNESLAITLAGNSTFGGAARWDFVNGSLRGPYNVIIDWASGGYGEWNTVAIATNVGTIEVAAGTLGVKSMGSTFGNPTNTFQVDSGATADFWTGDSGYARNFHGLSGSAIQFVAGVPIFGGNLTLENSSEFVAYGGSGTYDLNGTITLNGTTHFVFGDANVIITNVISGPGGFVWDAYNHELFLQAANTYTGPTVLNGQLLGLTNNGSISHSSLIFLNGATIDVTNRIDTTLTLTSGQTLAGIGTIGGTLMVPAGATLSPGGTNNTLGMNESGSFTGTITATKNVNLNGNTILKLDGSGVNDQVASSTAIAFGGTLTVTNISSTPLEAGNSFQIFSAPNAGLTGSFASTNLPTLGAGLAWDFSQLNTFGFLNVVSTSGQGPLITSTSVSSGNLIFSGTGGTPGANYVVLTTTNLATPLANWVPVVTNIYGTSGNFNVTNPISTGSSQQFYRLQQ